MLDLACDLKLSEIKYRLEAEMSKARSVATQRYMNEWAAYPTVMPNFTMGLEFKKCFYCGRNSKRDGNGKCCGCGG